MTNKKIDSYKEFWPFYLHEHRKPATRALHFAGTSAGIGLAAALAVTNPWLLPLALIPSYGAAWIGHFGVEKNKPATFTYPLWSFAGDFRMMALWCSGKLETEFKKFGLDYTGRNVGKTMDNKNVTAQQTVTNNQQMQLREIKPMSEENKKSGCCGGEEKKSCCKSFDDVSKKGCCGTENKADHGCGTEKKSGCCGPRPSQP